MDNYLHWHYDQYSKDELKQEKLWLESKIASVPKICRRSVDLFDLNEWSRKLEAINQFLVDKFHE